MTLENWNSLMYVAFVTKQSPIISMIYLILWIFIGNYVLLNLFLAILLDGFGQSSEDLENHIPDDLRLTAPSSLEVYREEKEQENIKVLNSIRNPSRTCARNPPSNPV